MDDRSSTTNGFYAGWLATRTGLLAGSVDRVFALLADPAVDDEGWRLAVGGETVLWRALADADSPPAPAGWDVLHRRGADLLDLLVSAGDDLRAAIGRRDGDLFVRSMARLDEAEKASRTVFAAAFALADDSEGGG